jgi:hypothetical protein
MTTRNLKIRIFSESWENFSRPKDWEFMIEFFADDSEKGAGHKRLMFV